MVRLLTSIALAVLLVGCGKETPVATSPPPAPPAEPTPQPNGGGGSGRAVVAEPSGVSAMPSIGDIMTAPVSVMIEEKRRAAVFQAKEILRSYEAMHGERPKSLEEAARAMQVKCPLLPQGWRWKYDPATGDIDVVKD